MKISGVFTSFDGIKKGSFQSPSMNKAGREANRKMTIKFTDCEVTYYVVWWKSLKILSNLSRG